MLKKAVIMEAMALKKNAVAQSLVALRNQKLSPERRSEIAKLAAERRWGKQKRTKAK